jgi:hypothetical protein
MGMVAGIILLFCGVVGAVLGLIVGSVVVISGPPSNGSGRNKMILLSCFVAGCIGGIGYGYFFHIVELFNNVNVHR